MTTLNMRADRAFGLSPARERFVRARSERVRRDSWMKNAARTSKLTHRLPIGAGQTGSVGGRDG